MPIFATAVFVSAFLLFSVQPMVAKFLLPTFGGTPAVWAACLAVFQVLLLGGYAYAHWLCQKLKPAAQRWTHFGVLAVALLFLPPVPRVPVSAHVIDFPVTELIRALATSIGLPFLALSATAPLLMEWFHQSHPGRTPDRLYAFSNTGSLLALLFYAVLIEPVFGRHTQAELWAGGMALFVVLCVATAWTSLRRTGSIPVPRPEDSRLNQPRRTGSSVWLWILLPGCGSALLLAVTNQICQDVAPVPLLWVCPMAVYLRTFILCFEGTRSYRRGLYLPVCLAALFALAWLLYYGGMQIFIVQVGGYLAVLFVGCMVCHGELYRLRPGPERITAYYLCIALGGALGGTFVAILAPIVFRGVFETPLTAALLALIVTFLLWRESVRLPFPGRKLPAGPVALAGTLALAACLCLVMYKRQLESIYSTRSFYGVYQVKEGASWLINNVRVPLTHGNGRTLVSGQVYHGFQFTDPACAALPTTYYSPESGLNVALQELPAVTNRYIGAIGLGVGTLATYGRPGDRIRFYELSPDVLRIARRYFTFLSGSAAHVDVVMGDARLSLEREPDQHFNLLVLDAFSGDSIPTHLLTDEAMNTYLRHLEPEGVIAVHISNNHLDLQPVVRALAEHHGLKWLLVPPAPLDPATGKLSSIWMLLSASDAFLSRPRRRFFVRFPGSRTTGNGSCGPMTIQAFCRFCTEIVPCHPQKPVGGTPCRRP